MCRLDYGEYKITSFANFYPIAEMFYVSAKLTSELYFQAILAARYEPKCRYALRTDMANQTKTCFQVGLQLLVKEKLFFEERSDAQAQNNSFLAHFLITFCNVCEKIEFCDLMSSTVATRPKVLHPIKPLTVAILSRAT